MPVLCSDLESQTNLGYRSFFSLSRYVNEFIQIISVFERSSYKLRWTVIGIVLCFSHQACCLLYIWARFTVAFTRISLPLNLNTSVFGCVVVSDLNKNFGGSTDLAKKRHGLADLLTPIHPPHRGFLQRFHK